MYEVVNTVLPKIEFATEAMDPTRLYLPSEFFDMF